MAEEFKLPLQKLLEDKRHHASMRFGTEALEMHVLRYATKVVIAAVDTVDNLEFRMSFEPDEWLKFNSSDQFWFWRYPPGYPNGLLVHCATRPSPTRMLYQIAAQGPLPSTD